MGELLEYLVPIIVGAVYLLSQSFSKSSQEQDPTPGHRPGRPDPEVMAREQEIRDQIRRKIQERRQAADEPAPARPSNPIAKSQRIPDSKAVPDSGPMTVQPQVFQVPSDTYETLMEAQLRRIEATKARAAALQKKVSMPQTLGKPSSASQRSAVNLQSSVRKSLKNPSLARRAIVYKEILDAPMALRTSANS